MKRSGFPPARQALPILLSGHPEFRGFALTDTWNAGGLSDRGGREFSRMFTVV